MNPKKIVPVVVVLAILATAVWWFVLREDEATSGIEASGSVEATEATLGFQAGGRIAAIESREGQPVVAGAVLARLDGEELQAKLEQASARIDAARAQLAELQHGFRSEEIGQAEAAVSAAAERVEDARKDRERTGILHRGGAVSDEAMQKASTALDVSEAQLRQAREQLALLRRGPRPEKIDAAKAALAEAEAARRAAEAQMAHLTILAPHAGVVTVRHREPNEIIAPGQPVLTVMNPGDRWVRIYVPENRIGAVRVGETATIRSDTYPDKRYQGRVTYISPEAEFTPKSVQTTEERVRLVYAVKVRIENDPELELKPGMPADVTIDLPVPQQKG